MMRRSATRRHSAPSPSSPYARPHLIADLSGVGCTTRLAALSAVGVRGVGWAVGAGLSAVGVRGVGCTRLAGLSCGAALIAIRHLRDEALGYTLFGTEKTADFFKGEGVPITLLHYKEAEQEPCIDGFISRGDIHLVLMFSNQFSERILTNYAIRRLAVDYGVPLITNIQVAAMFADALEAAEKGPGADPTIPLSKRGNALDVRSLHEWYE
eukprot:7389365-Prymnesium_polylepis.1